MGRPGPSITIHSSATHPRRGAGLIPVHYRSRQETKNPLYDPRHESPFASPLLISFASACSRYIMADTQERAASSGYPKSRIVC